MLLVALSGAVLAVISRLKEWWMKAWKLCGHKRWNFRKSRNINKCSSASQSEHAVFVKQAGQICQEMEIISLVSTTNQLLSRPIQNQVFIILMTVQQSAWFGFVSKQAELPRPTVRLHNETKWSLAGILHGERNAKRFLHIYYTSWNLLCLKYVHVDKRTLEISQTRTDA